MPLAQRRDWSSLIQRLELAATLYANTHAVYWRNPPFHAIGPGSIIENVDAAPLPPIRISGSVTADVDLAHSCVDYAAHEVGHGSGIFNGMATAIFYPAEANRERDAEATLLPLIDEIVHDATAGESEPDPSRSPRRFLLTLLANESPDKIARPSGIPGMWCRVDSWPPTDWPRWRKTPPESRQRPNWWCVAMPNLFRKIAERLKSIPVTGGILPQTQGAYAHGCFRVGEHDRAGFGDLQWELLSVLWPAGMARPLPPVSREAVWKAIYKRKAYKPETLSSLKKDTNKTLQSKGFHTIEIDYASRAGGGLHINLS